MNKKLKSILIGGIALLVLIGVVLALKLTEKPNEPGESSAPTSAVIVLWKNEAEEVVRVEAENEKGGYLAEAGEDGLLTVPVFGGKYDLKHNDLVFLQNNMATLTATRVVEENPDDLQKYGLESPVASAEITLADQTSHTVRLGAKLPTDGGYYAQVDSDPSVYAIATTDVDKLLYGEADFLELEILSQPESQSPDVSMVQVDGAGFSDKPLIVKQVDGYGGYGKGYRITSPIEAGLNSTTGMSLIEGLYVLSASEAAGIAETEEELAPYGLQNPYAVVTYIRDGEEGALRIGDETALESGGSARYLMKSGSSVVYKVPETSLPWLTADIDNLFSSLLLIPSIETVDTVSVDASGENYLFQSSGDAENIEATLNGSKIDSNNYRAMYEYLISASAREINYGSPKGESLAKITYHYRDAAKEDDIVEFFAVNDRQCILSLNGSDGFLTETRYVDKLIANCQKVLNGETPSLDY